MIHFIQNTIDNENVVQVYLYNELLGVYRTDRKLTDEELAEMGSKLSKKLANSVEVKLIKGKS